MTQSQPPLPDAWPREAASDASLRLFIALPIPEDVLAEVAKLATHLRTGFQFTPCKLAWVDPATLHVTLRFLGDTPRARIDAIVEGAGKIFRRYPPLALKLREMGVFPHWRMPRTLWLGVHESSGKLEPLQREVEALAHKLGYEPPKTAFHAHLTLARFKSSKGSAAAERVVTGHWGFKTPNFSVPEAVLYASWLRAEGARHAMLARFPLDGLVAAKGADG